ncbi:unnamed protein product [Cuscuta campestris]|uniref:CCHC-type domain-containing protein n=1 Tax=Cuscuta campestris TaxID=132261 RepID=A0A484M318_9ASTE|nr:unnamed protein product [Cuscuta campestris]
MANITKREFDILDLSGQSPTNFGHPDHGSAPESNVIQGGARGYFKRGRGNNRNKGPNRGYENPNGSSSKGKGKFKPPQAKTYEKPKPSGECYKCGIKGHWANECRTAKHLVKLYQASTKGKGKNVEANYADDINPILPKFDVSDFYMDDAEIGDEPRTPSSSSPSIAVDLQPPDAVLHRTSSLPFDHAGIARARRRSSPVALPQTIAAAASFARGPPSASAPPTTVHLVVLPVVASTASVGRPRHRVAAPSIAAVSPSPEVHRSSPSSAAVALSSGGLRADVPGHDGPLYAAHGAAYAHVPATATTTAAAAHRYLQDIEGGAEEFQRDKMGEPQIALDWLKQMDRDPHTPKPWTWDRFNRAFTKEYVPTRYREERCDEFVALKHEGMSLPALRQKFDYLSQYATSLVSTPEDRLNEFVKKLRPDLRSYAALITTTDFNAAYDLIVKTEKSLDDLQATKKEDRATKDPRPAASTGPSGKSFGFGGKRYEKGSSSAPPPKRNPTHVLPTNAVTLDKSFSYEEEPVKILARETKVLRNKTVPLVKVLWRNHAVEEATWETEESMRTQYPHLFGDQ